jgi:membrane protease YdiL (CAAX protease family)
MLSDAFASAIGAILFALWLIAGFFIYVSLARQIQRRAALPPEIELPAFRLPEVIVALILISFLLLNVVASVASPATALTTRDLIANLILTVIVLFVLVAYLQLRGFDLDVLAGLSKFGIARVIGMAMVLLLCAYPIITAADWITQKVLGQGSSRQTIIELFDGSRTIEQRVMIILLAVAIAPIAEEFVFRFYLYGVLRGYLGRLSALLITSLLFAAVHAHLPSFAPLFVLGCCFTLAYEWSGSILVTMAMHSLFNTASLFFLAFPNRFS